MGEILLLDAWKFKTKLRPYDARENRAPPGWRERWPWPPNNVKRKFWKLYVVARFRAVYYRLKRKNTETLAQREKIKGDMELIQGGYDGIASRTKITV
jgi:hypothetical protein